VQDLLDPKAAHEADLESFSRGLLAPYIGTRPDALATDGPMVKLNHNEATLLSLVLNELATNATKYGAWSVPTGRVELAWRMSAGTDQRMNIEWQERGGPPVEPPRTQGFGSSVMRVAIERGLRGSLTTDYDANGIRYTMTVPRSGAELTAEGAVAGAAG
jgi:two-component sensor histidine kinase